MSILGDYVRARREALHAEKKEFSIRKLAARVGVHHSYLSKLERGGPAPLKEQRIRDLARELGEDPELLLALSGKLSERFASLAAQNPQAFMDCMRRLESSFAEPLDGAGPDGLEADGAKGRRQLEDGLRRHEMRRGAVLDSMEGVAVFFLDRDLTVTWASGSVDRHFGCQRADAVDKTCYMFLRGSRTPCRDCSAVKAMETGESQEGRVISEDGRRWVIRSTPLKDSQGQVDEVVQVVFDVTDLENARLALEASEQKMRLALKGARLGVWEFHDLDEPPVLSAECLAMLGYSPGDASFPTPLLEFLHPGDHESALSSIELLRNGEAEDFEVECRLRCKEGSWRWVQARGAVLDRDTPGGGKALVGVLFDIHDHKTAELKLEASEARYRNLFLQAPIGIYTAASDGRYLAVNPKLASMYGYQSSECMLARLEQPGLVYTNPEDRDRLLRLLKRRGEVSDFECQVMRADGSLFWTSRTVRADRTEEGGLSSYTAFVTDIQAAKEAEQASSQARRQLLGVMEQLEAAVFVIDPATHNVIYSNGFLKRALGFEPTGRTTDAVLGPGEACTFCLDEQAFIRHGDALSREVRFSNGRWYLCRAKVTPWPELSRAVLVVATDITEMRRAQEIRDDVDRIIRHDLKSPLSGVINIPDLILEGVTLPEEETRLLSAIKAAGRKMQKLIDSSLTLSRLERGEYELARTEVDLLSLMFSLAEELRLGRFGLGVELRMLLGGRPAGNADHLFIRGDENLLYSIFSNLVKNALEATKPGGVVTVDLQPQGDFVETAIHNPARVPREMEERFFEKYATSNKIGGTGLGTYSAMLAARAHGGRISMCTSDEAGTTLIVSLPC